MKYSLPFTKEWFHMPSLAGRFLEILLSSIREFGMRSNELAKVICCVRADPELELTALKFPIYCLAP